MRVVLTVTLLLIGSTLLIVRYPSYAVSTLSAITNYSAQVSDSLFYNKQIVFKGNRYLSSRDLEVLLPLQRGNLWWSFNSDKIIAAIKSEPLVADVSIGRCADYEYLSWGCYEIHVIEQEPSYIALSGDRAWLVSKNGGFIAPLVKSRESPSLAISKLTSQANEAVKIKGLFDTRYSPEVIEAKLKVVSQTIEQVNQEVGLQIEQVNILHGGELELLFKGQNFLSVIEFGEGEIERIRDQARRLNKVLLDNKERLAEIERVDLAFNKMAVLRFRN